MYIHMYVYAYLIIYILTYLHVYMYVYIYTCIYREQYGSKKPINMKVASGAQLKKLCDMTRSNICVP